MATDFTQEDLFVGKQILVDSDRLVFNGREDITFSANKLFLFKTNGEFHINTEKDTFINTPRIYLGPVEGNQDPNVPAVKSDELKKILRTLIFDLKMFFRVQYPKTSGLQGPNPGVNKGLAVNIIKNLNDLDSKLDSMDSQTVFIR
jgi:hypothetical protein